MALLRMELGAEYIAFAKCGHELIPIGSRCADQQRILRDKMITVYMIKPGFGWQVLP
jgi:hypothetical protein